MKWWSAAVAVSCSLLFCACVSSKQQEPPAQDSVETPAPEPEWTRAASLDDIYGIWTSAAGVCEYPFYYGGKKYLRYSGTERNDTALWEAYARRKGMSMTELWAKRYAHLPLIYGQPVPQADDVGSQRGLRLYWRNDTLYSREEWLIPERIVALNLSFFQLSRDKTQCKGSKSFHFTTSTFGDKAADGYVYTKTQEVSE